MNKIFIISLLLSSLAACSSGNTINKEIDADEDGYKQSQKRIVISPHSGRVISK